MDEVERLLRRLALNDEESVGRVLVGDPVGARRAEIEPKLEVFAQLAALLALGGATTSLRTAVHRAADMGASESEIVEVLVAIGPVVGFARVVAAAPRLAAALGYDLDE